MPKFVMLVGLPGSGKTTWAKNFIKEHSDYILLSSDTIREELFGSESVQNDPEKVFKLMLNRTITSLKESSNVIYDATNISRKRRVATLREIKSRYKNELYLECVVIAPSIKKCLERNKHRDRLVDDSVIIRMVKSFDIPLKTEGWDEIRVEAEIKYESIDDMLEIVKGLSHENSHHTLDVYEHSIAALNYLLENYSAEYKTEELCIALPLHDIGKKLCKTHYNRKGEYTDEAHFYNHANVGSYIVLLLNLPLQLKLDAATLIGFHMRPLEAWKESKKAEEKDRLLLGDKLYNEVKILSICDTNADKKEETDV